MAWGKLHGILQIIEKALGLNKLKVENGWVKALRIVITFLVVNFAWIFFRMPTIGDACCVIGRIFDFNQSMTLDIGSRHIFVLMILGTIILFIKDLMDEYTPTKLRLFDNNNRLLRWVAYVSVIVLIMLTGVFDAGQFIYANF